MEYRTLSVFPSLSFSDFKTASKRSLQLKFDEAGELFFNQFKDLSFLPPYKIYDSNGNEIDYNQKDEYLAGNYSRKPFADHYIEYNGADTDFLEYVFDNGAERNLLIIGDSCTNAIEPLLASHYHHTYAVDIRHLPDYYFSLSEFLSEYAVDDVLVLGGPSVVMHQWRWTINP